MAGFFKSSKLRSVNGPQRSCIQCGLISASHTPKMGVSGKGQKGILVVGDFLDSRSDKAGMPMTGPGLRLLTKALFDNGISLERDCFLINTVNCNCGRSNPSIIQIEACRKHLQSIYKKTKPSLILLLGNEPMISHWGHRWKGDIGSVFLWRGNTIPDHHFKTWTGVLYSPRYLLDHTTPSVTHAVFKNDLKKALSYIDRPLPKKIDEDLVEVINVEKQALSYLKDIWHDSPEYLCFDYETTGIKPHHPGHKIACTGIATDRKSATAFMMTDRISYMLKKILGRGESRKIAQNMKFEETWSRFILGTPVKNWYFDPMIAGHILDNRKGVIGLKFQSFVRYGVCDYDSHITPYLKSKGGPNSFNRVFKAPRRDLLIYCGMDAILEYNIAFDMMKEIGNFEKESDLC